MDHYSNMILIFSFTWGIGGNIYNTLNMGYRTKFSDTFKTKFQSMYPSYPMDESIFNLYVNFQEIKLKTFETIVPKFKYERNVPFFNILVPTAEYIKHNLLIDLLMKNNSNLLITGNSGVGKSILIK